MDQPDRYSNVHRRSVWFNILTSFDRAISEIHEHLEGSRGHSPSVLSECPHGPVISPASMLMSVLRDARDVINRTERVNPVVERERPYEAMTRHASLHHRPTSPVECAGSPFGQRPLLPPGDGIQNFSRRDVQPIGEDAAHLRQSWVDALLVWSCSSWGFRWP